jgi:hypothetical protein
MLQLAFVGEGTQLAGWCWCHLDEIFIGQMPPHIGQRHAMLLGFSLRSRPCLSLLELSMQGVDVGRSILGSRDLERLVIWRKFS